MKGGMIVRRALPWGVLALLVAVGGLAAWPSLGAWAARTFGLGASAKQTRGALEKLEVYGRVPEFSLTERSGREITLSDLLGQIWVVNFFYTECTETCPLQSAHMARLQADLVEADDLRLVSISVDPEHDTVEVLSEYAKRYGADPERWLFLTGSRDAIYRLALEGFHLGVADTGEQPRPAPGEGRSWLGPASVWAHAYPNPQREPLIHSSRFVLVDHEAQIRGYYHGTDWEALTRLRENLLQLLRKRDRSQTGFGERARSGVKPTWQVLVAVSATNRVAGSHSRTSR